MRLCPRDILRQVPIPRGLNRGVFVMIVPSNRLLLWTAMIVVPFALLGAVEPSATVFSAVAVLGFVGVAVIDAMGGRSAVAKLKVVLPPVIRVSKDRECRLDVQLENPVQKPGTVRLALGMPEEVVPAQEAVWVALPGGVEQSRFGWVCTPRERGNFRLSSAHLEVSSPFGFWAARKAIATQCELRVYPNLGRERRTMAALFLK
ncbi:MAG TPA: hypothetical protein VN673_03360, partial [Clostridia bacterium]|nr:hypothetical protein [Clostridia bacterium]